MIASGRVDQTLPHVTKRNLTMFIGHSNEVSEKKQREVRQKYRTEKKTPLPSMDVSCIWYPLAITRTPPKGRLGCFKSWSVMSIAAHCSALIKRTSSTKSSSRARKLLSLLWYSFVNACSAILIGEPDQQGGKQTLCLCSPPKCIDLRDTKLVTRQNKPFDEAKPEASVNT